MDSRERVWVLGIALFAGTLCFVLAYALNPAVAGAPDPDPLIPGFAPPAASPAHSTPRVGEFPGTPPSAEALGRFRAILVWPMEADSEPASLEEGEPWHAQVDPQGRFVLTERGRLGRDGVPEGWPREGVRRSWIVAVPRAAEMPPERRERLHLGLLMLADRMQGLETPVILPDAVPGLSWTPPAGIDGAGLLPLRLP